MKDTEQTVETDEAWMCEVTFLNSGGELCSADTDGWGPVSTIEQAADLARAIVKNYPHIDRIDIMLVRA